MRWLGLDVGDRRIGVALSDPLGLTAQPLETYTRGRSMEQDLDHFRRLCAVHQVTGVVVGLPLDRRGEIGRQARKTLAFAEPLRDALDLPLETWDERMSTQAVQRVLLEGNVRRRKRKQVVDKLAASYILQGFLDHERLDAQR